MTIRRPAASFALLLPALLPLLALLVSSPVQGASTRSCGDHHWEPCEWCGQDAYQDVGWPEMNHDCQIELVDFGLFAQDYALTGPGLSGDFNADTFVDLLDFQIFAFFYNLPVDPCVPCGLVPDGCTGMIRLSANLLDPQVDEDQIQLSPGVQAAAMVVVEDCPGLMAADWTLHFSPNVQLLGRYSEGILEISSATAFGFPLDGAAHFLGGCSFVVLDDDPAWIRLTSAAGPGWELAWAQIPPARKVYFPRVAHLGINGPPPPDSLGCQPSGLESPTGADAARSMIRCRPNPAREQVRVSLQLAARQDVDLVACDVLGRVIRHLHAGMLGPGTVELDWDGCTQEGDPVAPGIYWLRIIGPHIDQRAPIVWLR